MKTRSFAHSLMIFLLSGVLLAGCGGADSSVPVGAKLYDQDGQLWGTVVETSESHTFENGEVEPGVKVDYGARMGNPPVEPQWLPLRSAEQFDIR